MTETCLSGPRCGLCWSRRLELWPVKPLTPGQLDHWFGEATNYRTQGHEDDISFESASDCSRS